MVRISGSFSGVKRMTRAEALEISGMTAIVVGFAFIFWPIAIVLAGVALWFVAQGMPTVDKEHE